MKGSGKMEKKKRLKKKKRFPNGDSRTSCKLNERTKSLEERVQALETKMEKLFESFAWKNN